MRAWTETRLQNIEVGMLLAARRAADDAARDLGLNIIGFRFFEASDDVEWNPYGSDRALGILNAPPIDPEMLGKACHPEAVRPLTIWLHASLSAAAAEAIVYHECRHLWQEQSPETAQWSHEQREDDANRYATAKVGVER